MGVVAAAVAGNYAELAEKQGLHVFEWGEGSTLYDARGPCLAP